MDKQEFIVTDIYLAGGESEVWYEYIFEDVSKDIEFEKFGTFDVQEIVLRNQERFTFNEEPTLEFVASIFGELVEKYGIDEYVKPEDFGLTDENIFYTGRASLYRYNEVVGFDVE